jgi:hypothetical protein
MGDLLACVLQQYRKTFVGTQIVITVVTVASLVQTHRVIAAAAFFAMMQLGAFAGAAWAASLKSRIASVRGALRS